MDDSRTLACPSTGLQQTFSAFKTESLSSIGTSFRMKRPKSDRKAKLQCSGQVSRNSSLTPDAGGIRPHSYRPSFQAFAGELPSLRYWVSLSIKNRLRQVEGSGLRKQQVKILERFSQKETLHAIRLCFLFHVAQGCVAGIGSAIFHKAVEECLSHIEVAPIFRELVKIVCRLDNFRTK